MMRLTKKLKIIHYYRIAVLIYFSQFGLLARFSRKVKYLKVTIEKQTFYISLLYHITGIFCFLFFNFVGNLK